MLRASAFMARQVVRRAFAVRAAPARLKVQIRWSLCLAPALTLYGALGSTGAIAAEGMDEQSTLQEVIVTAQKKREDIQVVPISMTAISSDAIALQGGTHDLDDILSQVSNLSFEYGTANGNDEQGLAQSRGIAIRGISGPNTTSLYIDDTPVPVSMNPVLLDIDHVEVLKGPQGTLYGEASMGGTVKIVTQQPSTASLSGLADADGHYLNRGGAGTFDYFSINAPVSSDSAMRFGGFYSYDPGFLTRTYDDPSAIDGQYVTGPAKYVGHVGSQTAAGGIATYLWHPEGDDNFDVEPMVIFQRTLSNGLLLTDYTTSDLVQRRALNVPEGWTDTSYLAALTAHLNTGIGKLTSSTSYFWRDSYDQEDGSDVTALIFGLAYVVPIENYTHQYNEELTQEFRLDSQVSRSLTTTAGIYVNDTLGLFNQLIPAPGAPAASGGALGALGYAADVPIRNYEAAAYFSGTYTFMKRLSVTAGVRYSDLDSPARGWINGFYAGGFTPIGVGYHAKAVTPRLAVEYQVTDRHMIYATTAKGFRPGGGQQLPSSCTSDLEAIGLPPGVSQIKSDSVWNFEVGSKNQWFDGKITANLALYDMEWKNMQENVALPTCGFTAGVNAAGARSQGGELELAWTPVTGVSFGASSGYENAKITAVGMNSVTLYVGQPLNGVPKWTASVNSTLDYHTRTLGRVFFRIDYSFVGSSVSLNNSPVIGQIRPAYRLLNVRVGTEMGDWEYSLYGKNLLNEYPNLGDEISEIVQYPSRPRYVIGPPLSIGLEVRRSF